MKKVLGLALAAILLSGCSGAKETTTVCKASVGEISFRAKGDEVLDAVEIVELDVEERFGFTGTDAEIKAYILDMLSQYDVEEITIKIDVKDDGVATVKLTYDYAAMDESTLAIVGIEKGAKYISLEKTIEEQEKSGYTCKVK